MAHYCRSKSIMRALILAIFLSVSLIISVVVRLGSRGSRPDFKLQAENRQKSTLSACPVLSVRSNSSTSSSSPLCSLPELTAGECSQIKALFQTKPEDNVCDGSPMEMCKVLGGRVECHKNQCNGHESISLGLLDPQTGQLFWRYYSFLQDIEEVLNKYIQQGTEDYFPFCFLMCDEFWNSDGKSQLLLLPPRSLPGTADETGGSLANKNTSGPYNINILLLDSVSRPHFYRSLPETIQVFQDINSNGQGHVLDFEFFHALRSRTFESLNALFSGEVIYFNDSFSGIQPNPGAIAAHAMFKKFKEIGYQTLWQDDICWLKSEWGIARELAVVNFNLSLHERWSNLKKALKEHGVDHSGITHSACQVSNKYNVPQFFSSPPKICYGGQMYHKFFLEHIHHFLREIATARSPARPLLSLTLLNIGHEGSGRRIQQLDASLASFIKKLAEEQNTLSIVLSDHGNSYGNFTKSIEGRFETFQPHLFAIIPDRIARLVGKERFQVLQQNQKRLITIQDLHFTIMSLFQKKNNSSGKLGLFQPIPANRTCQDLPLIPPYLCICQGWESKVSKSSVHSLIAEFALGKLNELLQGYYAKSSQASLKSASFTSGFGSCERLIGQTFKNVRERRLNALFITSMDLYVQKDDVFHVEVTTNPRAHVSLDMQVLSFTRLSEYGIYQSCADTAVPLDLCVCEVNKPGKLPAGHQATGHPVDTSNKDQAHPFLSTAVFGSETMVDSLHENCLFLLMREYSSGVTFEVRNTCAFVVYKVELILSLQNMQTSSRVPVKTTIKPGRLQFLVVVIQLDLNIPWKWQYTVNFSWEINSVSNSS